MVATTTRNADLSDMLTLLKEQQARKLDVITPASKVRFREGKLIVKGVEPVLSEEGVTLADGTYNPTRVMDEGIAAKLGIHSGYWRKLRDEGRWDLLDNNFNGWMHGKSRLVNGKPETLFPADERQFMLRLFKGEGGEGVGRAWLSDKFARIENLDILLTVLDAIQRAGIDINIEGGDLSDRRMYLRITAPQVQALAPALLHGYRSPFSGSSGTDNPVVWAGIEIKNSEVGNGAFTITPRMKVLVCSNGMTVTKDAMRSVHLGSKLEEGTIDWTEETQRKNLDLIQAKTRDAVTTFLNVDYMTRTIQAMEAQAGVKVSDPAATLKTLTRALSFDDATAAGILDHFIKGGQVTAGGVLHAVTSYAQTVQDADAANELEGIAFKAMELAAAAA